MTDDEGREVAAGIFDVAAFGADVAVKTGDPIAVLAGGIAGGIARVVASLIRSVGVEETQKLIEGLHARKNEGAISDRDIAAEDRKVDEAITDMFADTDVDPDAA